MGRKTLDLSTLAEIDNGTVGVAVAQALERCVEDITDRPLVGKAREVLIAVKLEPVLHDSGVLDGTKMTAVITEKLPIRKTRKYDLGVTTRNQLFFEDHSLDNHKQTTIDTD